MNAHNSYKEQLTWLGVSATLVGLGQGESSSRFVADVHSSQCVQKLARPISPTFCTQGIILTASI